MWEEQIELQESCEEVKKLLKEIHEKICDLCVVRQQVGWGSGGTLPTSPAINRETAM